MSKQPGPARQAAIVAALTCAAMVAFAANSVLTRLALRSTAIDPASFIAIRLGSGALVLALILRRQRAPLPLTPRSWLPAALLFTYALAFSFAYREISAGAGALVLFASAQLLMISVGWWRGERASPWGLLCAGAGMAVFLAPSATAPPLGAALMMATAGFAWGGFSLVGKVGESPVAHTAASFVWSVPLAALLLLAQHAQLRLDWAGAAYALLSGSVASALGYAVWYWVRVRMTAISAGAVQLSVPVLSALLGVLFLGEVLTWRSGLSGLAVLGGIAWVMRSARRTR